MSFRNFGLRSSLALLAGLAAAIGMGASRAQADVLVTEIWQRGSGSTTPDWFELTNISGATIDPSSFYYDDDHADPTENAQLAGITSLAPGESAVYLVSWQDDFPGADFPPPFDPSDALAAFDSFWGTNGAYQVGYILVGDADGGGGHGLSGGGDEVNIYDGNTAGANLLDSKSYTGTNTSGQTWFYNPSSLNMEHSQAGVLGAYLSVDGSQVGSPGNFVPEPGCLSLMIMAGVAGVVRRRGR